MPGHYSDRSRNIWSVPTPTGANALPACGVAWAMQLKGLPNVAVAEVVAYRAPDEVEGGPEWLLGKLSWRGQEVPVVWVQYSTWPIPLAFR